MEIINFGLHQIRFHRIILERCQGLVLIFCLQSKQRWIFFGYFIEQFAQ